MSSIQLDVSVKIESIETVHDGSTESETITKPEVRTEEVPTLGPSRLQVKLSRLPTFLLKLFKQPSDAGAESPQQSEESDESGSEKLGDVEPVLKSRFRLAVSRLLASANKSKPVVAANGNGDLHANLDALPTAKPSWRKNETSDTHQIEDIAADIDIPRPFNDADTGNRRLPFGSLSTSSGSVQGRRTRQVYDFFPGDCYIITYMEVRVYSERKPSELYLDVQTKQLNIQFEETSRPTKFVISRHVRREDDCLQEIRTVPSAKNRRTTTITKKTKLTTTATRTVTKFDDYYGTTSNPRYTHDHDYYGTTSNPRYTHDTHDQLDIWWDLYRKIKKLIVDTVDIIHH